MKIEKLNDNQIRCTLTSQDLASRKLKLSELAYGTEKARMLFQDMMSEANQQFGFNIDNSPLMVEAIPVSPDSIVLIITKVDDPQELDSRFSKFAPFGEESAVTSPQAKAEPPQYSGADDILELLQKLHQAKKRDKSAEAPSAEAPSKEAPSAEAETDAAEPVQEKQKPIDLIRCFYFPALDDVITCARIIGKTFHCHNTLYKTEQEGAYLLVLHQQGLEPADFNKLCNMISEYAMPEPFSAGNELYVREHGQIISEGQALLNLSVL